MQATQDGNLKYAGAGGLDLTDVGALATININKINQTYFIIDLRSIHDDPGKRGGEPPGKFTPPQGGGRVPPSLGEGVLNSDRVGREWEGPLRGEGGGVEFPIQIKMVGHIPRISNADLRTSSATNARAFCGHWT
jgi:hypothetical protein